jgi:hypothetical protein
MEHKFLCGTIHKQALILQEYTYAVLKIACFIFVVFSSQIL